MIPSIKFNDLRDAVNVLEVHDRRLDCYWPNNTAAHFRTGADKLLIVSVGTGTSPDVKAGLNPDDMNILFNATTIPSALMFAALNEQDLLCRVFGDCLAGDRIDRELGDLAACSGPLGKEQKLFTYMRYNAELTRQGLNDLGCTTVEPEVVQKLDSIAGIDDLLAVGEAVGRIKVKDEHFAGFPPQ